MPAKLVWTINAMPNVCELRHRYHHKFAKKACVYGLADGSILLDSSYFCLSPAESMKEMHVS